MSKFLASSFDSIPAAYLILQAQNVIVGNLTAHGWQLLGQVDGAYSDVIPPATETIGNGKFREVVRIYFPDNTTIKIGGYQACIADAYPQSIRLTAKTPGAVQAGVTINGVQVLGAAGSSGSTANDNLRSLFYALQDSTNPTIQGWSYAYNGSDTLIATCKTIAAGVSCSGNANVNYFDHAAPVLAGARSNMVNLDAAYGYGITTDLTNGFVYYMDVFARSFSLSTKTLAGTFGTIFASYLDHAEAVAALPDSPFCTPIELVVGMIKPDVLEARGRTTHCWGIYTLSTHHAISGGESSPALVQADNAPDWHPWTGHGEPNAIMDASLFYEYYNGAYWQTGAMEFVFTEQGLMRSAPLETYKILPIAAATTQCLSLSGVSDYHQSLRYAPILAFDDIRFWSGTEPNETSAVSQVKPAPSSYPKLAQALDATTAYGSILFDDASALNPAGGTLIIGTEEFDYTGLSGTSATGVTRARNGTTAARHFIGDVASPGTWFLRVNNAAICAGSQKPT